MFGIKREKPSPLFPYNEALHKPAVLKSICTGEATAGFVDKKTSKFSPVMLIKSKKDLAEFRRIYKLSNSIIPNIY